MKDLLPDPLLQWASVSAMRRRLDVRAIGCRNCPARAWRGALYEGRDGRAVQLPGAVRLLHLWASRTHRTAIGPEYDILPSG